MPKSKEQKRREALERQQATALKELPRYEESLRDEERYAATCPGSKNAQGRVKEAQRQLNLARERAGLAIIGGYAGTVTTVSGANWATAAQVVNRGRYPEEICPDCGSVDQTCVC